MAEEWTHGEIVRSLARIEKSVSGLESKVDGLAAGFVPRGEWALWSQSRDREIADLKAARAPWWTWVTVGLAAITFVLNILPKLLAP